MKRAKRANAFKTWDEFEVHLDELVFRIDNLRRRTPIGTVPPDLRRCLRKAVDGLIEATSMVIAQREIEKDEEQRLACARLRAQGIPELPGHVRAELKRMRTLKVNRGRKP